jgi:hypothetical protein
MIIAESGGVRLEAGERALLVHAPGPPATWPQRWLRDPAWWRFVREWECLEAPFSVDYEAFWPLLRDGFRLPLLLADWSPFTVAVDAATPPRFLLGDAELEIERRGPYVRRLGDQQAWMLDEASWRLLETPPSETALVRDLAMEANAQLRGYLREHEIVYSEQPARKYATRRGWVDQRHVHGWSGPVKHLTGRVGLRDGLPVRLPGRGRVLCREDFESSGEPPAGADSLNNIVRSDLQALVAASFIFRGFRVVLPASACWMDDCVLAVRNDEVTVVCVLDEWDDNAIRQLHLKTCRFRRACPSDYHAGFIVRSAVSKGAKREGTRQGFKVRDRYEFANMLALDPVPSNAVRQVQDARCTSPGETVERLREARMLR